ncbi:MAG: NAD(P)H dehydrogenase (quinone) [Firmicutes bacterium ADurb.Bin182]|nr:MAG: NAD(P)H dehydrogenase (quinone) [Firmicutes bacterium ADurb.Bin182]
MKIGIVVHSQTGNTLAVAKRIMAKLSASGHTVSLLRVSAINDDESDIGKIRLSEKPDIGEYDALLFGAPVRGFSLSPVMQAYLNGVGSFKGKKTACFMTQAFPFPWMGGNRALGQLVEICRSKGADPYGTGIVNWANAAKREELIESAVEKLGNPA